MQSHKSSCLQCGFNVLDRATGSVQHFWSYLQRFFLKRAFSLCEYLHTCMHAYMLNSPCSPISSPLPSTMFLSQFHLLLLFLLFSVLLLLLLPPFLLLLLLFYNSPSAVGTACICMGVGPCTGTWSTHHGPHPLMKVTPPQLSAAVRPSASVPLPVCAAVPTG